MYGVHMTIADRAALRLIDIPNIGDHHRFDEHHRTFDLHRRYESPPTPQTPTKKESKQRFEILRKLGSGTYGKVSMAMDHKANEEASVRCAIDLIKQQQFAISLKLFLSSV